MPIHRDVSEESPNGIVSISLGCDGIFIIAKESNDTYEHLVLRVTSGDIVHISGESRFAWHSMSNVLSNTCPNHLKDWPFYDQPNLPNYKRWKGWFSSKRLNISCRQVYS